MYNDTSIVCTAALLVEISAGYAKIPPAQEHDLKGLAAVIVAFVAVVSVVVLAVVVVVAIVVGLVLAHGCDRRRERIIAKAQPATMLS